MMLISTFRMNFIAFVYVNLIQMYCLSAYAMTLADLSLDTFVRVQSDVISALLQFRFNAIPLAVLLSLTRTSVGQH